MSIVVKINSSVNIPANSHALLDTPSSEALLAIRNDSFTYDVQYAIIGADELHLRTSPVDIQFSGTLKANRPITYSWSGSFGQQRVVVANVSSNSHAVLTLSWTDLSALRLVSQPSLATVSPHVKKSIKHIRAEGTAATLAQLLSAHVDTVNQFAKLAQTLPVASQAFENFWKDDPYGIIAVLRSTQAAYGVIIMNQKDILSASISWDLKKKEFTYLNGQLNGIPFSKTEEAKTQEAIDEFQKAAANPVAPNATLADWKSLKAGFVTFIKQVTTFFANAAKSQTDPTGEAEWALQFNAFVKEITTVKAEIDAFLVQ